MLVVNHSSRQLKVYLAYRNELVGSFRKLAMCSWNRSERCDQVLLRTSETINLKIRDIDSIRMQIRVDQGKGKKDLYTLLGTTTLKILREYVKEYKPKEWMFEGESGGQYSPTSIRAFSAKQ